MVMTASAWAAASAGVTADRAVLVGDTVWDVMRLLDYLATRPDVDMSRIGLLGHPEAAPDGAAPSRG